MTYPHNFHTHDRDVAQFCEGDPFGVGRTGPLPSGPGVLHSARACMDRANQPTGAEWVRALTAAAVKEHMEANGWEQS
jgi:hypothetical protein